MAAGKFVKKIPSSENGEEVHCKTQSGKEYLVSYCIERGRFSLWKELETGYELIGTARTPMELYDMIPWNKL